MRWGRVVVAVSPSMGAAGADQKSFGEAEVENFGVAAIGDENIGGLDVAVDDAFSVGGVEGVGDLGAEVFESRSISSGRR